MHLDKIKEIAEKDLPIDDTELGNESVRIPQLHNKYLVIFHDERLSLGVLARAALGGRRRARGRRPVTQPRRPPARPRPPGARGRLGGVPHLEPLAVPLDRAVAGPRGTELTLPQGLARPAGAARRPVS